MTTPDDVRALDRWDGTAGKTVNRPDVDAYLAELIDVGKRHGFVLGHEDFQGAFVVTARGAHAVTGYDEWLMNANIEGTT